MKNTGITYTSAERSPVILPEMAELLPPLSAEQSAALEEDLLRNGCYSPIIVNEDMVIVDGHNRQALCEKHGLPYTMAVFSFEDLLEAKQWALDTQKGRRNLEKWELGKIALKLKPEIEAWTRQHTIDEAVDAINAAGVPAAPINDMRRVTSDDSIVNVRQMFVPLRHPVIGDMRVNGNPVKLLDMMPQITRCAPELGQDNQAIYGELLGLDETTLQEYKDKRVI